MSHSPASVYLVWSIMCFLLGSFLLWHLWKFDRFKCLRWNHGPYSGAFKRIMTYTYMLTIPLLATFAVGFTILKYDVGYSLIPGFGIIPTPWQLWPHSRQQAIFPLQLLFSIGWSFEMITHLEELCFWLFLVNAGSVQQDWFRSLYFKTWIIGSVVAVIYMPLVTIFTRSDPLKSEAFTFLAGSLGSLSLTLWFLPILWTFPSFLRNLKKEGVDIRTIVRLTTFHELNCVRVIFRLLFVLPFLILAVDGVRSHQHVNTNGFGEEFLAIVGAFGCTISSGITLVIFFPRSIEGEVQARYASREKSHQLRTFHTQQSERDSYFAPVSPIKAPLGDSANQNPFNSPADAPLSDTSEGFVKASSLGPDTLTRATTVRTFTPNRRLETGVIVEGGVSVVGLTERNLARHNYQLSNVHPFLHNFTSPIDLMHGDQAVLRPLPRRYNQV
ncbi:hypothetical protein CERSUDRAFT_118372 [Gelatoporia subvermispora B]|uniref:Uncharacterized protein n=1 Tax=Ceriporiopsis subvermispora (strain B) TaxID=914234 RepID=M2QLE8_CERS8|nr:hypothetical protein CERSUDRAFT_118372 [Gelatoporia subvermispora B]